MISGNIRIANANDAESAEKCRKRRDEERVGEQSDRDARDPGQDVGEEPHAFRTLAAAEQREFDARQHADRSRDQDRDSDDDQRPEDAVRDAASRTPTGRGSCVRTTS